MDLFDIEKLNNFKNDSECFSKLSRGVRMNPKIAEYYDRLGDEYEDLLVTRGDLTYEFKVKMSRRAGRLLRCGRYVDTTKWVDIGVHKVNGLQRCSDKFCGNCQKQLSNAREHRYEPLLKELSKHFDLYHITLTVPNVSGLLLPVTVEKIISTFSKFVKFFRCKKKIRGVDFEQYGCLGAIRSLEITMNKQMTTYHPHLHCIFVFSKGLRLDQDRKIINAFSFDRGRLVRKFTEFEVFVQRLWKSCYVDEKVTKSTIESSDGFSCNVNYNNGNYHQIFKYAIEGLLADKKKAMHKDKSIVKGLTFEEFRDLYFALENRRVMQGYGCFYGFKFDDSILDDDGKFDRELRTVILFLNKEADTVTCKEKLHEVIKNIVNKNEIYFSDKSIRRGLNSLREDE